MIELLWDNKIELAHAFILLNEVLTWMAKSLLEHEEYHDVIVNGYLVARDEQKHKFSTLILCEAESQKRLLHLLQQPPEEFKGRYTPCILSSEPESVSESPGCSGENSDDQSEDENEET